MDEREYLKRLRSEAGDTVRFLSEAEKQTRERSVCAAFLRCLGVPFIGEEIKSWKADPPDVIFRSARFEILEVLDPERKRHDEWRIEAKRPTQADSLGDLLEPYRPRVPLSHVDLVELVTERIAQKTKRYDTKTRDTLDALVYINLKNKYLDTNSPMRGLDKPVAQGCRSASVVMPPYALILYAEGSAPAFLRDSVRQTKQEWTESDKLFEL